MERGVAFKKGSDQGSETRVRESLTCESCGARVEKDAAKDEGWQVRPPVCPNCLRWNVINDAPMEAGERLRITRCGRHWAVYENGTLLCMTVYRKGAEALKARLSVERRDGSR